MGINTHMAEESGEGIQQPWIDLKTVVGETINRNYLAGRLLTHLIQVLRDFDQHGLAPFLAEWRARDAYQGREVSIHQPHAVIHGTLHGVDDTGALLLSHDTGMQRFHSGEVSLRLRS
jgi:BirA family biotin operon repressor/biotin-[acetyl-CoA-carboxylase] ligase